MLSDLQRARKNSGPSEQGNEQDKPALSESSQPQELKQGNNHAHQDPQLLEQLSVNGAQLDHQLALNQPQETEPSQSPVDWSQRPTHQYIHF